MRINLKNVPKGLWTKFVQDHIVLFAEEYAFGGLNRARDYVFNGKQGLETFVNFLSAKGYKVEMFYLKPNRDMFMDVGDRYGEISRSSPSYGFILADDDPKVVEYKLRHG